MDAIYNEKGEQIPDNTPVELPIGYTPPEDLQTMIRRMVTDAAVIAAQQAAGIETFEEADDFDVMDEDATEVSGHEFTPMQEEQFKHDKAQLQNPVDKVVTQKRSTKATAADDEEESERDEKPTPKAKKKVREPELEQ